MNIVGVLTAVTGLVATIGGLTLTYVSLKYQHDKDKPHIKVAMGENRLINVPDTNPDITYLTISVANIGKQDYTVTITGVALGKRSGGAVILQPLGTVQVPHLLEADKTCTFWTEYDDSIAKLKALPNRKRKRMRIRAYVSDYAQRSYYSNWHVVDFDRSQYWGFIDNIKKLLYALRTRISP